MSVGGRSVAAGYHVVTIKTDRNTHKRHRTSAPSDSLVLVHYWSVFTYLFTSSCLHAVTSAESLTTFCCLLKTHLFRKSFPDYLLDINWLSLVDLAVVPLLKPPTYFWLIRLIFIWFIHEVTVEGRDDCSCCWSLELCVCSASSTVLSKIYHDLMVILMLMYSVVYEGLRFFWPCSMKLTWPWWYW